jgi:dTDP-D-glucose 4,6-dehydratase
MDPIKILPGGEVHNRYLSIKLSKKKPIDIHGDGSQTRTFTFVEDTVSALFYVLRMRSQTMKFLIPGENRLKFP